MDNISTIIHQKYGIEIKPGKKGECFSCHKNTFSIKTDNSFGKCFHPTCGIRVTGKENEFNVVNKFMDKFYEKSHGLLITTKCDAYKYLQQRGIHPKVIFDAAIGIFEMDEDLEKYSQVLLTELINEKNDLLQLTYTGKKAQLEINSKIYETEKVIEEYKQLIIKIMNLLKSYKNSLCFFYTNETYGYTMLRLRKPFTKEIAVIKIGEKVGVFGLSIFGLDEKMTSYKDEETPLIVMEGEFNNLSLQSLVVKKAEQEGQYPEEVGYLNCISIGSSSSPDFETINKLSKMPTFIYDNDAAGLKVIENAMEYMHLYAFTMPNPFNDIDELIIKSKSIAEAWNSFIHLFTDRVAYYRKFEVVAREILSIRNSNAQPHNMNRRITDIIINDLTYRAIFYKTKTQEYLFNKQTKLLFQIDCAESNMRILLYNYGLNPTENLYKFIIAEFKVYCIINGKFSEINNFSFYCKELKTLYLYANNATVYKVSGDKIENLDNGTDGIIFLHNEKWSPFQIEKGKVLLASTFGEISANNFTEFFPFNYLKYRFSVFQSIALSNHIKKLTPIRNSVQYSGC